MKNIIESIGYNKEDYPRLGNMFFNGNGYLGVRGTLDEYRKDMMCSINLAGIYDKAAEDLWRESVNAPNGLYISLCAGTKPISLPETPVVQHTQKLDFHNALQQRETTFAGTYGNIKVTSERFASMFDKHLICVRYTVTPDDDTELKITSGIDTDIWNINGNHFKSTECSSENGVLSCLAVTIEQGYNIKVSEYSVFDFQTEREIIENESGIYNMFSFKAEKGKTYTVYKFVKVETSKDERPSFSCLTALNYDEQKLLHTEAWNNIWDTSYVKIDGDSAAERALNYSIYHLNCIAPRHSSSCSIPARGLSGQVYKGAIFWDTEMFMLDYFLYTNPAVAKSLVRYRIDTIDGARAKAAQYGYEGAFYAWESHEGGIDACTDYNLTDVFTGRPMRTYFRDKQVHVSAAIVYALKKYIDYTGDRSILADGGLETVIECAKFYRSILIKYANKSQYEIHDVIGPDEYHERVNNNAYTNRMAKFVFDYACELLENNKDYEELYTQFKECADNIYVPQPRNEDGVIEQFDTYFSLEDCNIDDIRSRLLDPKEYWGGAYGPAAQTQILKQADIAAMLCMFKNDYSPEVLKANMDYYEPRTEHGSSLSACMYSLLSCYNGEADKAYPLFMKSAGADLDANCRQWLGLIYIGGTHPAAAGGAWMTAIFGFAGLTLFNSEITCKPCLPTGWTGMHFKINHNGNVYRIDINGNDYTVTKEKSRKKAVIFDLDGVLVSTDELHYQAWLKLADDLGITNFTKEDNRAQRGVSRMQSLEILLNKFDKVYTDAEKEELAERKNNYYKEFLKSLTPSALLEGAKETLVLLKKNGIPAAIGSASKNTPAIIELTEIVSLVDEIACGLDITKSKPDPEVFLTAAKKLRIAPSDCIVVEDSDAGIEAAKSAGMIAVAVGDAMLNQKADYRGVNLAHIDIMGVVNNQ